MFCEEIDTNEDFKTARHWTTDQHLRVEDTELFVHSDTSKRSFLRRASEDVRRDVLKHGIDVVGLLDSRVQTTIRVRITAAGGDVSLNVGQIVKEDSEFENGILRYLTLVPVSVVDGTSIETELVSLDFGEPFNDTNGLTLVVDGEPNATVETLRVLSLGCDHQLTLAATYRAMELTYQNYMRERDDCFDMKRATYRREYNDEIARAITGGFLLDLNEDDEADSDERETSYYRLRRG